MASKPFNKRCLDQMRSQYHELLPEEAGDWKRRVDAYHEVLRKISADAVEEACKQAPLKWPDKMPTAKQLGAHASTIEREQKRDAIVAAAKEREEAENDAIRARWDDTLKQIPNDQRGQERWEAEGIDDAERLARHFEVQSKQLGLDPTKAAPQEVELARIALFRQVLGVDGLGQLAGDVPPALPQPQPPRPRREPGEDAA